jgi:hypothetical protein
LQPLTKQFHRYEAIFDQFEAARKEASAFDNPDQALEVRDKLRKVFQTSPIVEGTRFKEQLPGRWALWEKPARRNENQELRERLTQFQDERRKLLDIKALREKEKKPLTAAQERRLAELEFEIDLGVFELTLRDYEGQPWKTVMDPQRRARMQSNAYRFVVNAFVLVLGEPRNERLDLVRNSWPALPRLCVDGVDLLDTDAEKAQDVVGQTALINRLDLMNARAALVDAWRQIAVFANALLGTFNVEYHLDSFSPLNQAKPLAFSASSTRNQLILNTELPLVRMQERNNYRASLISYQRQRRALMETEDQILATVRNEIRQLRLLAENYKIQQRQVELAYLTVESSLDTFRAPPPPTPAGAAASNTAVSAASLTQQLLGAQSSLPQAQNSILSIWISYLTFRLQLYRDLELMQLDSRGVWIDEFNASECGSAGSADNCVSYNSREPRKPRNHAGPADRGGGKVPSGPSSIDQPN